MKNGLNKKNKVYTMKKFISTIILFLAPSLFGQAKIDSTTIFPFQEKHVHSSGIVELPNGDFLTCWFQGSGERIKNLKPLPPTHEIVDKCIECGLCHITCEDTSHQAIAASKDENGKRIYTVIDEECVGCNLCYLVCPVPKCISMNEVDNGLPYLNWTEHPNNPM